MGVADVLVWGLHVPLTTVSPSPGIPSTRTRESCRSGSQRRRSSTGASRYLWTGRRLRRIGSAGVKSMPAPSRRWRRPRPARRGG